MRKLPHIVTAALLTFAVGAQAEQITLKGVSAFADGTTFSKNFQRFVDRVNETGAGVLQINYLGGGGKVMNPFELGKSIQTGVVDIGNLPGAFYTNLLPEADAMKLSAYTIQEERENGAWDFMNQLHNDKMNVQHIARQKDCVPFHLYLNKKIDSPDLSGLKIRVTPIYRAFFDSLGATSIRTAPGDVYTALERGAVDGYGWPTQGVLDLGWHEVTQYRIDPPFYRASVEVLMNLDSWNKLDEAQKTILSNAATWWRSNPVYSTMALIVTGAKRHRRWACSREITPASQLVSKSPASKLMAFRKGKNGSPTPKKALQFPLATISPG